MMLIVDYGEQVYTITGLQQLNVRDGMLQVWFDTCEPDDDPLPKGTEPYREFKLRQVQALGLEK